MQDHNLKTRLRTSIFTLIFLTGMALGTTMGQTRQQEDRDQLTIKAGKKVTLCTVMVIHEDGSIEYSIKGGKPKTLERKNFVSLVTIDDRLGDYFKELDKADRDDAAAQWVLAEWLIAQDMGYMARLQAYRCLCIDSDFEKAHAFLRHKKSRNGWFWRRGNELVSEKEFLTPARGRNDAPKLESAHFWLRAAGNFKNCLGTLIDLERVRLEWKRKFGKPLGIPEYQDVLGFDIGDIPNRSTTDRPYFDPSLEDWIAFTEFKLPSDERPQQIFSLLTQQLLNCLYAPLGNFSKTPKRTNLSKLYDRDAVWFELGFGWWFGEAFQGEPGYASYKEAPTLTALEAGQVLEWMNVGRTGRSSLGGGWKDLPNFVGWHFDQFYQESDDVELRWLMARAFVAFMMSDGKLPDGSVVQDSSPTSELLLNFARSVFRSAKGSSSSRLDEALGFKVERLEKPFIAWLRATAKE